MLDKILIYSPLLLVRLNYIATTLLGDSLQFTDSKEAFNLFDGFKINYSPDRIGNEQLHIAPHGLLEQTNIQAQQIECFEWESLTVFFKTNGDIPFDFFAASFYLLTRYEEYLPHEKDEHGRYKHENSLAYRYNFLQQPLIQLWLEKLISFHGLRSTVYRPPFYFKPSYDIDIAYSYLHHAPVRNVLGYFKDLIKGNLSAVSERVQVLTGVQKDPYDVYEWLNLLHSSLQLKPIYFYLLANKREGRDKNLSPSSAALQQLIKHHAVEYEVGIHPSIQSNSSIEKLTQEKVLLEKIVEKRIVQSRQHYIKMGIPHTYRRLIEAGIREDYSMGYARMNGFRASYTAPFYWFDLGTNTITTLKLHSFCYMDAAAIFHERIGVEEAAKQMQYYFDTIKKLGGEFIPVLHNNFLTTQPEYIAWRNSYADFLLRNCLH